MPFGKIYSSPVRVPTKLSFLSYLGNYLINILQQNPRTTVLFAVAKANGLEIETVSELPSNEPSKGVSAEYLNINGLGKIPTFQGEDGFILSECIAIAIYRKSNLALAIKLFVPIPLVLLAEPHLK